MDTTCIIIVSLIGGGCLLGSCLFCFCDCKCNNNIKPHIERIIIINEPPPYNELPPPKYNKLIDPPLYSECISSEQSMGGIM